MSTPTKAEMAETIERLKKRVAELEHYESYYNAIDKQLKELKSDDPEIMQSKARLRLLFNEAAESIFVADSKGWLIDANNSACEMMQYTREELKTMNIAVLVPPEEIVSQPIRYDLLRQGKDLRTERKLRKKNGEIIYAALSSKMLPDNMILGIVRDISASKQMEMELIESEEQYRRLVELSPNTVLIQSEGKITFINHAGLRLLGAKEPGELLGKEMLSIVHPDYRELVKERIRLLAAEKIEVSVLEEKYIRLDGTPVDVEVSAVPFTYKGRPAVQVIIVDITKRKEAEEELNNYKNHLENLVVQRTSKLEELNNELKQEIINHESAKQEVQNQLNFLKTLVQTIPSPIYIKSPERKYLDCNKALLDLYGFSREDAIGNTVFDVTPPEYAERINASDERVLRELGEDTEEAEITDKKGRKKTILIHKTALLKQDGTAGGIVGVITDITSQRELQRKMESALASERGLNELKSQFLSLASHEFRTPLTSIKLYADLIYNYNHMLDKDKYRTYLEKILKTINYMAELIDDVLTISRVETGKLEFNPVEFDLYQFCSETVNDLPVDEYNREIKISYQTGQTMFRLDKKLLTLILVNLLTNAVKYSPRNSTVKLSVGSRKNDIIIKIKDKGIGILETDKPNLFEYFYRGENTGDIPGTGLGLSIVKKSVELHGGDISMESRLGKGTTFTIRIPVK